MSESRHLGGKLQLSWALHKMPMASDLVLSLGIRETDPRPSTYERSEDAKEDVTTQQMGQAQARPPSFSISAPDAPTSQMRTLGCSLLKGLTHHHQAEPQKKDDKALFEARHNP